MLTNLMEEAEQAVTAGDIHIRLHMSTSLSSTQNLKEHWMIVNAIASGDAELAKSTAKFHVRNAYKTILTKLS